MTATNSLGYIVQYYDSIHTRSWLPVPLLKPSTREIAEKSLAHLLKWQSSLGELRVYEALS